MDAKLYMCAKLNINAVETGTVNWRGDSVDYYTKPSLCNIVRDNRYTFVSVNEPEDINYIISRLGSYRLNDCIIHICSRPGYDDEFISKTTVSYLFDAAEEGIKAPVSVIIENPAPKSLKAEALTDESFSADVTKLIPAEQRGRCISSLKLSANSVLYDIGSCSGEIAVSAAVEVPDIQVYAIEKKPERYVVINENRCRFACDNVRLINGIAPEVLDYISAAPTHVFIRGCKGQIKDILSAVQKCNPDVRAVVWGNKMETESAVKELNFRNECICIS